MRRGRFKCNNCQRRIGKRTRLSTGLCRKCWLANKPDKCKKCGKAIRKDKTKNLCHSCYKRWWNRFGRKRVYKTESHKNCFECNKELKRRFVKFCSRRCLDKFKCVRRRAKKASVTFQPVDRYAIYKRDEYRCYICKKKVVIGAKNSNYLQATLDHIVPLHLGGHHTEYNLATCCRRCNTKKGKKLLVEYLIYYHIEQEAKTGKWPDSLF